jgi:FAD:protein FMN transferase
MVRPDAAADILSAMDFFRSTAAATLLVFLVASGCSSKPTEVIETREAFGAEFTIDVVGPTERSAKRVMAAGWAELDLCVSKLDPDRPDSDISRINAQAGGEPVPVDSLTATCLAAARESWQPSGGSPGMDKVEILGGPAALSINSVRLPEKGMRLDLGGFVEGHVIDRIAQRLKRAGAVAGVISVEDGPTYAFGVWPPEIRHATALETKPAKP